MSSMCGLLWDGQFMEHRTGAGHPERPRRLEAIRDGLEERGLFERLVRIEPTPVDREALLHLHTPEYLARLEQACHDGRPYIDAPDSAIGAKSFEVARLAAGGILEAVRRIGRGELRRAFCAVRPPGHHAEADRSMGFCLLANAALAADTYRREFGARRILILDWDVHHGNGTQHLFEADPQVYFISLHGHPDTLYPGTGYAHERGIGAGEGYTLNLPMLPGANDDDYRRAFEEQVLPAARRFRPELLIISAGFDAHFADPLAALSVSDDGFAWMSAQAIALANECCDGRVLSVLEGGYDLAVLRRCVAEHVAGLASD